MNNCASSGHHRRIRRVRHGDGAASARALAAHPRVAADTVAAISAAMQQLDESEQGRQLLRQINFRGVVAARDTDWNDIRKLDIDLLDGMVAQPASTREASSAP